MESRSGYICGGNTGSHLQCLLVPFEEKGLLYLPHISNTHLQQGIIRQDRTPFNFKFICIRKVKRAGYFQYGLVYNRLVYLPGSGSRV